MDPIILAIDTSCDETAAAVVWGRRILSNVISSQVDIHAKYGGVYPALAKRAHIERIDNVVIEALRRASIVYKKINSFPISNDEFLIPNQIPNHKSQLLSNENPYRFPIGSGMIVKEIDRNNDQTSPDHQSLITDHCLPLSAVAVTQGPGLAIALEVGIARAKAIATGNDTTILRYFNTSITKVLTKSNSPSIPVSQYPSITPLIAINHLEGHILSTIAQNSMGNPKREIKFPALALVVSGGNTQMLIVKKIGDYEIIGETLDDACGEALDKAARILKLGYPGGPIIERLALTGDPKKYVLNPALIKKKDLNFSYSGLKTAFLYQVQKLSEQEFGANLANLAATFQYWAFEQIQRKLTQAIAVYQPKSVLCGGGVLANKRLRYLLHRSTSNFSLPIYFPTSKLLYGDNAAMIGIAAYYKYLRGEFIKPEELDRKPSFKL